MIYLSNIFFLDIASITKQEQYMNDATKQKLKKGPLFGTDTTKHDLKIEDDPQNYIPNIQTWIKTNFKGYHQVNIILYSINQNKKWEFKFSSSR